MKTRQACPLTIALLLLGLGGNGAFAAPATQEPADTYAFVNPATMGPPCGSQVVGFNETPTTTRLSLLNYAWMVSADDRLTGQSTVQVDVNINNVSGHIVAHGSLVLDPFAYNGTWEADFNIHAPGGKTINVEGLMVVKDAQINAQGTGVFDGQTFFFEHAIASGPPPYDIPVADPDGPGGCEFLGEVWSGRIHDPNES